MYPKRIEEDVIVRVVENEKIVFDSASVKVHRLNKTAALIWDLCDGSRSVLEIEDLMVQAFDAPREVVVQDVQDLLKELESKGLLGSNNSSAPTRR